MTDASRDPATAPDEGVDASTAPDGQDHPRDTRADADADAAADTADTADTPADAAPGDGPATSETDDPAAGHLDVEAMAASDPRSKAELLAELLEAETKRDEYLDDLRRSHADFENYRKRVMREGATQRQAGKAEVVEALLEVLDDLDRTLEATDGSADASLAKGIELVATKLGQALAGVGLERIEAIGVAFDPTVHEAVQQQPADEPGGEPHVAQVLRPGYRLGDRTLRAAMVVVEQ